jgi:hypothetical protein
LFKFRPAIASLRFAKAAPAPTFTATAAATYSTTIAFGAIPPVTAKDTGRNIPAVLPLAWKGIAFTLHASRYIQIRHQKSPAVHAIAAAGLKQA